MGVGSEGARGGGIVSLVARTGIPVAAVLAFAGQFLVSLRGGSAWASIAPGVGLYVAAFVLVALALRARRAPAGGTAEAPDAGGAPEDRLLAGRPAWILFAAVLALGGWLRLERIDFIPWGMNNDEAINAIEVEEIVAGKPFATLTTRGLNRETMFHYLAAFSYEHPGLGLNVLRAMPAVFDLNPRFISDPMTDLILPLRFVSIAVGTLTLAALFLCARAWFGARVALVATLLLAVSPWHLLYSRAGLRVILAPLFSLVAAWLFLRAWRSGRPLEHVAWGAAVGLGLWTYTSFRAVPLAFGLFALLLSRRTAGRRAGRRAPSPDPAPSWRSWRGALAGVAVAAALFVVMMAFSGMSPMRFLFRGTYAITPPNTVWSRNLFHAVTMLNYSPADYAVIQSDAFISDGISATFGLIGLEPDTLILAAFASLGLLVTASMALRHRHEVRAGGGSGADGAMAGAGDGGGNAAGRSGDAATLTLAILVVSWLTLGWLGPSLTRLLILLPWLVICGALLVVRVWDDLAALWRPLSAWIAAAVVLAVGGLALAQGYSNYFLLAGRSERAMQHFGATQTIMGMFARSVPPGHDLVVLHTLRVDTLRYLIGKRPNVHLLTDTSQVSLDTVVSGPRPITFLIEYARPFAEPLRALMMRYPQGDMTQVADARIDPDKIIFYTFTLLKDASGQIVSPAGGVPPQGMSTGTPGPPPGAPPETPPGSPPPGGAPPS